MAVNKIVIPPTTPGTSAVVGLDPKKPATVMVYTSGAMSVGLEYTLDNLMIDPAPRWLVHPGMPAGTSASGSALLTTPVSGVRLNVASNAAAVEFRVMQ